MSRELCLPIVMGNSCVSLTNGTSTVLRRRWSLEWVKRDRPNVGGHQFVPCGQEQSWKRWRQIKFLPESNSSAKGFGVSESWVFKLGLGLKLSLPSSLDFEFAWEPRCFPNLQVKRLSSQYLISWSIINIFPYPPRHTHTLLILFSWKILINRHIHFDIIG